jgi:hypothetical protein
MHSHNGLISQAYLKSLLHYDPLTGIFTWLKDKGHKARVGTQAGSFSRGWRYIKIDFVKMAAHRLAWLYMHGKFPDGVIDHINGVRSDNRIANLRVADSLINGQNIRRAHARSTTGLLGVSPYKNGRFKARILVNGEYKNIGHFADKFTAHEAYVAAKRQLHIGCTL